MSAVADPFGERASRRYRRTLWLLGVRCEFVAGHAALMSLVEQAFGGMPPQRLPGAAPACVIELRLERGGQRFTRAGPPRARTGSAARLLTGIIDAQNHAVICPASRSASVTVSETLLENSYYARYELLEFAVLTLLSRVRALMPLHAACIGRAGRGVLVLGDSGAGKSTLVFRAAVAGLGLLSEDSLFVDPRTLVACGLPAFVHLRRDAPRLAGDSRVAQRVRASPRIRRRSGELKYEVDLRRFAPARLAAPLKLVAIVTLTVRRREAALRRIGAAAIAAQLRREQAYASAQPGWRDFLRGVARVPAFELARSEDPEFMLGALRHLLQEVRS